MKIIISLLVVIIILLSGFFGYYYLQDNYQVTKKSDSEVSLIPTPTVPVLNGINEEKEESIIPAGWVTYTNQEYRFEISFPSTYRALTDANNLYGWPNGVVLIYDGGQSYDLVIETWNSKTEVDNKYKDQTNVTINKVGVYYLSLLNQNYDSEVDQIINTFSILK